MTMRPALFVLLVPALALSAPAPLPRARSVRIASAGVSVGRPVSTGPGWRAGGATARATPASSATCAAPAPTFAAAGRWTSCWGV